MNISERPKVALLVESSRTYGRDLLQGVALYARTQTRWSLLHQEMLIDAELPAWLQASGIDGAIARVHRQNIEQLLQLNVPIVDVLCHHKFDHIPRVETDDQRVAELAFEHLWERGFRRFAYCGFDGAHYSENRFRFFRQCVEESECPLSVYSTPMGPDQRLTSVEQSWLVDAIPVAEWLQTLEPPTGLLVCNDIRGQQVLNACRGLNILVPDELGVIGVDDDDTICVLCDPPLSSVRPDAKRVGYRAAEIMHEMLQGEEVSTKIEYVLPKGATPRLSTEVDAMADREVARICRFIREQACLGIDVSDVMRVSSLSRRQLERRFKLELNRTLHEEITRVRVRKVKELLSETNLTLEQITPLAGFSHRERMTTVFKRETGEAPGAFRRRASC